MAASLQVLKAIMILPIQFNKKRGKQGIHRDEYSSDREWITGMGERARALAEAWKMRKGSDPLVRYEDLVKDTSGTVSKLLDSLELEHSPELVEKIVTLSGILHRELATPEEARQMLGLKGKDKVDF